MRKDDLGLFEAYDQVVNNQQVLEEGILDRIKTGAAGAMASFQPKQRIKSAVIGGLGKIAGRFDPQSGQRLQQQSSDIKGNIEASGLIAKVNKILELQKPKLNNFANEIINDLNKLGLNPKGITVNQVADSIYNDIDSMLKGMLAKSTSIVSPKTSNTPKGKPIEQIFASDIGGSNDSMYQKYKDGWYERQGSKASGFTYSKLSDQTIIDTLEKQSSNNSATLTQTPVTTSSSSSKPAPKPFKLKPVQKPKTKRP
jgi:hypothetical protein